MTGAVYRNFISNPRHSHDEAIIEYRIIRLSINKQFKNGIYKF
jgi:hypothetical protein